MTIRSVPTATSPKTTTAQAPAKVNDVVTTTTAHVVTNASMTIDVKVTTKPAAQRERAAHAAALGCAPTGEAIAAAELSAAQKVDARVTANDMARAVDRARRAQVMTPHAQNVLSGFTRVIDAKIALTPALLAALASEVGAPDLLLDAIAHGPGGGAVVWARPKNAVELVASLVRQVVLGKGASMHLQLEPEHQAFIERTAKAHGEPAQKAMGGAGAFASNLLSALPNQRPRFFSAEPVPKGIAERFSPRVEVVTKDGSRSTAMKGATDVPARMNFSAEYSGDLPLTIVGRTHLKINGADTPLTTSGSGRVILGSRAKDVVPGFDGVASDTLEAIGKDNDIAFLVGIHYLTQGSPDEAMAKATALASSLQAMKTANPSLLRHHQYVLPKQASTEGLVMTAMRGAWDSLSMNAVEAPMLLHSLKDAKLTTQGGNITQHQGRDASEEPAAMIDGALAIKDGAALKRVHLHGLLGDLIVTDDDGAAGEGVDVDRTHQALLRARQLASVKAANDSGEIVSPADLFDVEPVVQGRCLAAVQRFADAVAARYGLSDDERQKVVDDWHFQDPQTKQHLIFVPSRGIHDRTGGTVSLGDTIDVSALVFSAPAHRARKSSPIHQLTALKTTTSTAQQT